MSETGGSGFDVALALQRVASVFWHDFAPIVVLGFGTVAVPQAVQVLVASHSGSTVVATVAGLLKALFVVIVSHGALARLGGRPLAAGDFTRAGIAASPRALGTALLIGAGIVVLLSALLVGGLSGAATPLIDLTIVVAGSAGMVLAAPAVPLALTHAATPFQAVARAAALTRGRRGGVAALLGIVAFAVIPARAVVAAAVYGVGASAARTAALDAAMTAGSPGLWLLALFDLLAWSVAAVVPAVVFTGLVEKRQRS